MATKIEWCEETWNPIVGCTKVSPGCDHCYAERMAARLAAMAVKDDGSEYFKVDGIGKYAMVTLNGKWNGQTCLDEASIQKPFSWKTPRKIFVCSMGDLFHESVSFSDILEALFVASKCLQHTFLLLTKRPERMREFFTEWVPNPFLEPLPNVWLGITAENQNQAKRRIPILLQIPAAKRFVSIEPMLGPVDFYEPQMGNEFYNTLRGFGDISGSNGYSGPKLDWVICGGESGPGARPLHPDWIRSIRDQCEKAGVPFFFKQWGEWLPSYDFGERLDEMIKTFPKCYIRKRYEFPDGINLYKVGKKVAGSLLDGKQYKEYPKS